MRNLPGRKSRKEARRKAVARITHVIILFYYKQNIYHKTLPVYRDMSVCEKFSGYSAPQFFNPPMEQSN